MKKLSVLIALILLAIAGTGYAQDVRTPVIPAVPTSAFDSGSTIFGLPLSTPKFTYGDKLPMNFTPIAPCRLVNTFDPRPNDNGFPTGVFQNGEIRTYSIDEGTCAGRDLDGATDVAISVVTFGVKNMFLWKSPGGRVLFTTPSSPTDSGGVMMDGKLPGFAYFLAGEILQNSGLVQLRDVPQVFRTAKGLGIQAVDGETHIVVDILGYAKAATGTTSTALSNGMNWKGAWSPSAFYATGDVVSAPNGTLVKTAVGWDLVSDGWVRQGLKTCLASSNDFAAFKACMPAYLQQ